MAWKFSSVMSSQYDATRGRLAATARRALTGCLSGASSGSRESREVDRTRARERLLTSYGQS